MTEILIDELGHLGDGVGHLAGKPVFVPFALPGERIEADIEGGRARLVSILAASDDRAEPPCPHYGVCGGCSLQHLKAAAYTAFKRRLVVDALADRGLAHLEVAMRRAVDHQTIGEVALDGLHAPTSSHFMPWKRSLTSPFDSSSAPTHQALRST